MSFSEMMKLIWSVFLTTLIDAKQYRPRNYYVSIIFGLKPIFTYRLEKRRKSLTETNSFVFHTKIFTSSPSSYSTNKVSILVPYKVSRVFFDVADATGC